MRGAFRHKESMTLKKLKTEIRERFNPYKEGKMTHNHIIHATDSEEQTHHILNAIGDLGIEQYYKPNLYSVPFFLGKQNSYEIKEVTFEDLVCSQASGDNDNFSIIQIPVDKSVQYKALYDGYGEAEYQHYIDKYLGTALKADHSLDIYLDLKENFKYLSATHANSYVIVKELSTEKYLIMDGLHRAALHLSQNFKKIRGLYYKMKLDLLVLFKLIENEQYVVIKPSCKLPDYDIGSDIDIFFLSCR